MPPEGIDAIDLHWMNKAYVLALKAADHDEVPVGAVLVDAQNRCIGQGWNQPVSADDPTAHAEILALRTAAKQLNNYRLPDTTLYVTLEPCPMCAGALVHARIKRLVVATPDPRSGSAGSVFNLLDSSHLNHRVDVKTGVLQEQCADLLKTFFQEKR
ncbi:MAG: tRNA adenosine(34) deaminase TadA [Gammaproteobacteria bacterium]|nr:MAG: tRNA adenosine(34) deaminase TadA [Gammaproteobacteria bacterium]